VLVQLRERVLQRQQGGYILTVEAGRSLLLSADDRAESTLQTELMEIQERWRHAHHRLDQQRRSLHGLLKVRQKCTWNTCESSFILFATGSLLFVLQAEMFATCRSVKGACEGQ